MRGKAYLSAAAVLFSVAAAFAPYTYEGKWGSSGSGNGQFSVPVRYPAGGISLVRRRVAAFIFEHKGIKRRLYICLRMIYWAATWL